ncbi:cytochrome P450 [Nocardia sp. NPDC005746]|uniref:cytochrome P450 n=1 Tax=Nocardia sp. NPDC005746 TaxID=3157062 RepID=UPI0033C8B31D
MRAQILSVESPFGSASANPGSQLDMKAELHAMTSAVTAATLFTHSVPQPVPRQMLRDIDYVVRMLMARTLLPAPLLKLPTPGNRAYERAITDLHAAPAEIITTRRWAGVDQGDRLSALIAEQDEDGGGLSDLEISDQVITFFVAGTETTATALAWALGLLDAHPISRNSKGRRSIQCWPDGPTGEMAGPSGGPAIRVTGSAMLELALHLLVQALCVRPCLLGFPFDAGAHAVHVAPGVVGHLVHVGFHALGLALHALLGLVGDLAGFSAVLARHSNLRIGRSRVRTEGKGTHPRPPNLRALSTGVHQPGGNADSRDIAAIVEQQLRLVEPAPADRRCQSLSRNRSLTVGSSKRRTPMRSRR